MKGAIYDPELQSNLAFFEKQLAEARPGSRSSRASPELYTTIAATSPQRGQLIGDATGAGLRECPAASAGVAPRRGRHGGSWRDRAITE